MFRSTIFHLFVIFAAAITMVLSAAIPFNPQPRGEMVAPIGENGQYQLNNAQRFAAGLPPNKPQALFEPSKTKGKFNDQVEDVPQLMRSGATGEKVCASQEVI